MQHKELIITHPGGAHFDEVTAISLVLTVHKTSEFTVERREPSEAELNDPNIWVIDVGDRHEPEKRNFDHHQSLDCPASFVLVAEYLGIAENMSVTAWWNFKDEVDRFGPAKASISFNAGDELVNENPVENWLTSEFVSSPESTLPILKNYGAWLISHAQLLKKQVDVWKNSRRLDIAGVPVMISETRDSVGLEEFHRLEPDAPDIVISLDRRDEGWRLFRYEGAPVDFSRIENDPLISFAHKTGFLAKTKERLNIEELTKLISKAVIR